MKDIYTSIKKIVDTIIHLEKKYNLGISPATIRNEMGSLTKSGFLKQPHTSAGRIPTPKAMKFYVGQLMEEKQMSLADEVKAKEEVWDARGDFDDLLEEATHALADRTKSLAFAATDEGRVWRSGYANVFANPEFSNVAACADIFTFLEEVNKIHELFFERVHGPSSVEVLFGEELGWSELTPVGIITTNFSVKGKKGALGVIGPVRLSYPTIIPVLRYFKGLIEEVGRA